jgi:hypothetical protein
VSAATGRVRCSSGFGGDRLALLEGIGQVQVRRVWSNVWALNPRCGSIRRSRSGPGGGQRRR